MRTRKLGTALFLFGLGMVASCASPSDEPGEATSIFDDRDPAAYDLAEGLAYDHLDARQTTLLYGVDDVQTEGVYLDDLGQAHTRLGQTLDGIPVFGAEGIVHLTPDGSYGSFTDGLLHDLKVDTTPFVADFDALEMAVAVTGGWARVTGTPAVDLQILRRDGVDYLAWRVQIRQFEADFDPAMPVVFVDAQFGDVVWQYDDLKHGPLSDATKRALDMKHGTNYGAATVADSSDLVANDAYVHTGYTLAYFQEKHGRNSFDGAGARVDSYVHYSTGYVNAYWDGTRLTFGDGDNVTSKPLVTQDIVAHEFSHGVTEHSADLIYSDESGALNEATSDIFAAAVESYRGGNFQDIWWVGEDCWLDGPALRFMEDPARVGDYDYYPTRYTGSSDNGGVHWNSGIANLAFYLLASGGTHPRGTTTTVVTGIGVQNAADIWYRALTVYMVPSTNFQGARAATIAAANDLQHPDWALSVQQAWDAVGVAAPPNYTVIDTRPNLSGASASQKQFGPYNTAGCTAIKFQINGGTGDSDLYVRLGGAPSRTLWDCRPYTGGNSETCEFNPSQSGSYYAMLDGYTAYSGVTLTVSAACAAPPPVEICADTFDNDGDSLVDCLDPDCASAPNCAPPPPPAEVCNDLIDNDLDGKTDCADTDCAAYPACLPPAWIELSNTNFETNFGVYTDGGADARRLSGNFSHQGTWSAEIRDNGGAASSFYTTNGINLVGKTALKIDFWFQARGMDNGDDFFVEVWNGSTWVVVGTYVRGPGLANNVFYNPVLTITPAQVAFTTGAKVRFRCDASNDQDTVYIDQVVISTR